MKKQYVSPAITEIEDYGNPLLDIGTTIFVDTSGDGASQSGAEAKAVSEYVEEDFFAEADSMKYWRDPLDVLPKAFKGIWDE